MVHKSKILTIAVMSVFFMTALLPILIPTGGADIQGRAILTESEPNQSYAQADELSEGDIIHGTLNWTDNDDVFKINVTAGMVMNVTLFLKDYNPAMTWEYNLDFEILSPNKIIQVAHWSEEKQVDAHSILVQETGFHFIWVYANGTAADHTLETDYYLTINATPPVEVGTGLHSGFIDADNGHYTDAWYKLNVPPTQAIKAVLTCPANGDFDLILYNRWPYITDYMTGSLYPYILNQSYQNTTGNDEEVEGLAMEGVYYIKVYGWSGSGTYQLQIFEISHPDDGDSTWETAAAVDKSGVTLSNFHQSYDMFDWYKISLKNGEVMNASCELMSDQGDVYFFFALTDQWQVIELWEYDTILGGGWTSSNDIDNKAAVTNLYSVGDADYYVFVRAIWRKKLAGDDDFKPASAMYKITWDLPDYGPDPVGPIAPITMDEDTSYTALNLSSYFQDPEDDVISYSYSPSPLANVSVLINQATGMVNITPQEDYNTDGDPVNITFKATDGDADWGKNFATIDTTLTINPVNDAPEILIPMESNITIKEEVVGKSNPADTKKEYELDNVFFDVDGDRLLFRASGNDNIPVSINQTTTKMVIGPVNGWYGTETITVTAEDPSTKKISQSIDVTVSHDNHPPTGVGGITEYMHNITEDMTDEKLDVALLFEDPDTGYAGDSLRYTIEYPLGYNEPFHMDVSLTEENKLLVVPDANFTGIEEVPIFARDLNNSKAMVIVKVNVKPVNDGPEIRKVSPALPDVEMKEGETKKFEVTEPYDVDDAEMYLNYSWYLDGERQLLIPVKQKYFDLVTDYTDAGGKYAAGTYELMVVLGDETESASFTWTIVVQDVNRDPGGVSISEPTANKKFEAGQKVTLRAGAATDPDGDTLRYIWTDDTDKKDLGEGTSILFSTKKLGDHKITLRVTDDRGGNKTASVTIKITEATTTGGLGGAVLYGIIGLVILIVIILVVVMVLKGRRGRRREPESAKDVADDYEAKLWGDRPRGGGPPSGGQQATAPAHRREPEPQPEQPSMEEPGPEPMPEPEPQEESVPTWTPGGPSAGDAEEPAGTEDSVPTWTPGGVTEPETKPGPPRPGPPE